MLNEDVYISLTAEEIVDGLSNKTNSSYKGRCFCKNGKFYISYDDANTSKDKVIKTILKFDENEMHVTRKMPEKNEMHFVLGQTSKSFYTTPYGVYAMDIDTSKYVVLIKENSIRIVLEYKLHLNNSDAGIRKLNFVIK